MPEKFWTNTIWFLALMAVSAVSVAFILKKAKDKRFTIAFLFAVIGSLYLMEHTIVVYFKAYDYHIGLTSDQALENLFGNIASQVSIACTAMLLIVYEAPFYWSVACAAAYFLLEVAFIRMGIYEHHWYRTWFTPVVLVPLFWVYRRWHNTVMKRRKGFPYIAALFTGSSSLTWHLVSLPSFLLGFHRLSLGIFPNATEDFKASNVIVFLPVLALVVTIYRWRATRMLKAGGLVLLLAALWGLNRLGVYIVRDNWFFVVAPVHLISVFGGVWSIDRLFRHESPRDP